MDCLSLEKLVIAINPVSKVSCKIDMQSRVPCGRVLKTVSEAGVKSVSLNQETSPSDSSFPCLILGSCYQQLDCSGWPVALVFQLSSPERGQGRDN